MRVRTILLAIAALVVSFAGATLAMHLFSPSASTHRPAVAEVPPLPPLTRTSTIVTPVAISLAAIRDSMERAAPRNLSGKRDNPVSQLLSNADIGWTMTRSPLAVSGRPEALAVSTALNGTFRVTGQISNEAAGLGGRLGGLVSGALGKQVQGLAGKTLDQRADIRGSVTVNARPAITPAWRIEPNLTAQASIADAGLSILGVRLNVASEVKPLLDREIGQQINALQTRLRNDPVIERAARRQWAKLCRSQPLGGAGSGLLDLWLEMRPVRAFAGQPRIDASALTLTIGVQAETRIVPVATKPDCPFPASLDMVA